MMIALVTVAVFIYRKPFQHLFSSVGYGVIGSTERAEYSWREASFGFRRASANAAGAVVPAAGAYRAARWARRNPAAAAAAGGAAGAAAAATAGGGGDDATGTGSGPGVGSVRMPSGAPAADGHAAGRLRSDGAPPASEDYADATAGGGGGTSGNGAANGKARQWPEAGGGTSRTAPPLPLPPRGGSTPAGTPAAWARGSSARGGTATGKSAAPPREPRPSGNGNGNGTSGTPVRSTAQPPVRRNASGSAGSASRPAGGNGWFSGGGTVRSDESGAAPPATERSSPMPFWLRPRRRDK
jgi:hypothetical protein